MNKTLEVMLKELASALEEEVKHLSIDKFLKPHLVQVSSGDGIGIDLGSAVAVTNKKNNVMLLMKHNYEEEFKTFQNVTLGEYHPGLIAIIQDKLKCGQTYLVMVCNKHLAIAKYLGNSMFFMFDIKSGSYTTLEAEPHISLGLDFYEICLSEE